jgi:hypothetical protein
MKLLNTLLFALTISAIPVTQTSGFSMSMAAPRPSLFKMNQTTQNVLKGLGIGAAIVGVGYLIYHFCLRKHTDQELVNNINVINNDRLVGELLLAEDAPNSRVQQKESLRLHGRIDTDTRTAWYKPETRRNALDNSAKKTAPLVRGTAILREIVSNLDSYDSEFLKRFNSAGHQTVLSQAQINKTQNQLVELRRLKNIYWAILADQEYTKDEADYNQHLDTLEELGSVEFLKKS